MKFLILVVLVMFCSRISSFRTGFYDKVYVYSAFKKFDPAPKFEVVGPAFERTVQAGTIQKTCEARGL